MVRIRGVCLCRFDPALAQYNSTHHAHNLAGTSVHFDQTAAPLILAQAGEIWTVVPATIAGPIFQRDHSYKADQANTATGHPGRTGWARRRRCENSLART
jgi:hypothetical protein